MIFQRKFIFYTFITSILFLISCSKTSLTPLYPETSVEKTNAIVVFGIRWIEEFDDLTKKEHVILHSEKLLDDKKNIEERIHLKSGTRLRSPLHYLSDFRFKLYNSDNDLFEITKFDLDLDQYQTIQSYALTPSEYFLKSFEINLVRFNREEGLRREHVTERLFLPKITWELEAGNIYYLGELVLYFKTKRILFGFFPEEEVNEKIELKEVEYLDTFEETKKLLQKQKPWLPTEKMKNISQVGTWERKNGDWIMIQQKTKQKEKIKTKRDQNKYFF